MTEALLNGGLVPVLVAPLVGGLLAVAAPRWSHAIGVATSGVLVLSAAALVGAVAIVTHGRYPAPSAEPDATPYRYDPSRISK